MLLVGFVDKKHQQLGMPVGQLEKKGCQTKLLISKRTIHLWQP